MKRVIASLAALLLAVVPAALLATTNPIQVTGILALMASGINVNLSVQGLSVAQSGTKYCQGVQAVPTTSGGTAIPCLTSLANLGYAMFVNLDQTNYVDIYTAVSGSSIIRLLPNDIAGPFRFSPTVTAPAALAHTATVNLQYLVLEN